LGTRRGEDFSSIQSILGLNLGFVSVGAYSVHVATQKGKQPLSVTHPALANQADNWDPNEFNSGSHQIVSWKCSCGHQWVREIRVRVKSWNSNEGNDCPGCNSFASKFPELAKEAHGWNPKDFSSKSGVKVEWKCKEGHIYSTLIANRANGSNCPICLGRKILPGFNDLATTHKDIASELVNESPTKVSKGTKKKFEWMCKKGHTFSATVSNRTAGYGCPYCSGNKVLEGFNDLKTTNPEIALELLDIDPKSISMGTHRKFRWKCPKGHIYQNSPNARTNQKQNCPFCSNKQVLVGFNDLGTTNPELAMEIHTGDSSKVTRGSGEKFSWVCELGHVYSAAITERSRGQGCPFCAGKKVLKGFNDIATTYPDIANELIDADPGKISKGSGKKYKWKCNLNHVYTATPSVRTIGHGCPYCSGIKVLAGFNDLETTHPGIALELFEIDPKTISRGSEKKFKWMCPLGHIYINSAKNRTVQGQNCSYCSGNKVLAGFNDLATTHPEIALELIDGDPKTISKGSVTKYKWKCNLGHIYYSKVNTRTTGPACPYCSGNKVLAGFNDLATTHPEIARELMDGDPETISKGSVKKHKWKCKEGHVWATSPNSRTNHGTPSGCPTCSKTGYDPNKNGWLYFMEHEKFGYLQIGITNYPEDRLKVHEKFGWRLLQLRGPMDGHLTADWETSILKMLRINKAQMGPGKGDINKVIGVDGIPFIGTEIWVKHTFPVSSINELMRKTEEFEEEIKKFK
jgi:hypothetical protein